MRGRAAAVLVALTVSVPACGDTADPAAEEACQRARDAIASLVAGDQDAVADDLRGMTEAANRSDRPALREAALKARIAAAEALRHPTQSAERRAASGRYADAMTTVRDVCAEVGVPLDLREDAG